MERIERDRLLANMTDDLESTTSEWADALVHRENDRADRALNDLEAIVKQLKDIW